MSTMLRTENLTYSYPAGEENEQPTLALDGVTLAIERGSFTVILGHNDISDLRDQARSQRVPDAWHFAHERIFRQSLGESLHLC